MTPDEVAVAGRVWCSVFGRDLGGHSVAGSDRSLPSGRRTPYWSRCRPSAPAHAPSPAADPSRASLPGRTGRRSNRGRSPVDPVSDVVPDGVRQLGEDPAPGRRPRPAVAVPAACGDGAGPGHQQSRPVLDGVGQQRRQGNELAPVVRSPVGAHPHQVTGLVDGAYRLGQPHPVIQIRGEYLAQEQGSARSLTCPAARHGHGSYQGNGRRQSRRPAGSQNPAKTPLTRPHSFRDDNSRL